MTFTPIDTKISDWIYVLDELPKSGEEVMCHGNKTKCCELDMQDAIEHVAVFYEGNFEIQDKEHYLMFVSRWKRKE